MNNRLIFVGYRTGYYKRSDLPNHFAIAEGWVVGDMYQESVFA